MLPETFSTTAKFGYPYVIYNRYHLRGWSPRRDEILKLFGFVDL
jgi:hypothetical protein